MENRAHALLAGLFTLLLGVAALAAIWWFGGKHDATKDYLVVTQQNVTGLNLQGQVRYRGIRVGKVQSIQLDPNDVRNILIRINVDQAVPVTKGTTAKLGYQGVTGIAHVLLEDNGSDISPLVGTTGEAPRIAMQSSLIQELSEAGTATLRQARDFLTNANDLLDGENRQRFDQILVNLETTSGQMAEVTHRMREVLAPENVARVKATLAHAERATAEVAPTLTEVRALLRRLLVVSDQLGVLVGDPSPNGPAALAPRLNDLGRELSSTSRQMNRVLQLLEESPQSLIFGLPPPIPGPGEPGFFVPPTREAPP